MKQKSLIAQTILNQVDCALAQLNLLETEELVEVINTIRKRLSKQSPFNKEPVDCVQWVLADDVNANDYNPNAVAPPEMELLRLSILNDGYTQPIVAWSANGHYEVVDGFHRNRVGKECPDVMKRVHGYLPLAIINGEREMREDRIAATIRHNRARGKHKVDSMSDIVVELKRRNWSCKKIGTELGMDQDEVLRLTQISGLAEMFKDSDFTEAWESDMAVDDFKEEMETINDGD